MIIIVGSKKFTVLIRFILLFSLHFNLTESSTSMHPPCNEGESSALLKFKHSFSINKTACADEPAYPKTRHWNVSKMGEGGNCWHCTWDGVECDPNNRRIMGLDLSSSCLYGSIDSTSTLFHLLHLRRLNLAFNDFKHSQIPSELGILSRLAHLNLSYSSFSGQIPPQVLKLTKLVSTDLEGNPSTKLSNPGQTSLAQNLTFLQVLHLSEVSMFSAVPKMLANSSSLTSLWLEDCGLLGEFPWEIFHLSNLQSLFLRNNPNLIGSLPEFRKFSPLQELRLANTSFYGELPDSIGNLYSLNWLDISEGSFSGSFPASMANLTQLSQLDLSYNDFHSQILPSWLGRLSQLTKLHLRETNLKGEIPHALSNLTQLHSISLRSNQLTGQIPYWLANLTRITCLSISQNKMQGLILDSIFLLAALAKLGLFENNLSGTAS